MAYTGKALSQCCVDDKSFNLLLALKQKKKMYIFLICLSLHFLPNILHYVYLITKAVLTLLRHLQKG